MKLKSKEEIEIMREGGRRHAAILAHLASLVRPGATSLELELEARRLIDEYGDKAAHLGYTPRGAQRPFPAVLCVSVNDEIVHGIPNEGEKVFSEGDIISIDLSLEHEGLITDSAITVPVGKVDDLTQKLLSATKHALEVGINAAKPGGHVGDIGAAISREIDRAGFALAEDLAGHGVGYSVHEDPFVPNFGIEGQGERLEPGLVIAIEPMVSVGSGQLKFSSDGYTISTRDGSKSAHFEHTVAITDEGAIVLTREG